MNQSSMPRQSKNRERLFQGILYGTMLGFTAIASGVFGYLLCDRTKVEPVRRIVRNHYNPGNNLGVAIERQNPEIFTPTRKRSDDKIALFKEALGEDFLELFLENGISVEDFYEFSYAPPRTIPPGQFSLPNPGESIGMRINRDYMRSNWNCVLPKPKDELRLIIGGGSTAWGVGSKNNNTTPSGYIEDILNMRQDHIDGKKAKSYNCAMPGANSRRERTMITDHAYKLDPDFIIEITGINDVISGYNGTLEDKMGGEGYFKQIFQQVQRLYGEQTIRFPKNRNPKRMDPEQVSDNFIRNIRISLEGISDTNSYLVVALQPVLLLVDKPLTSSEKKEKDDFLGEQNEEFSIYLKECYNMMGAGLSKMCQNNTRLIFADLNKGPFEKISTRSFLGICHFGSRGNKIIAERLAEIVEERINNQDTLYTFENSQP